MASNVQILIIVDGFQHGQGPFFHRRVILHCPKFGLTKCQLFEVPLPQTSAELRTYNYQSDIHGLLWNGQGAPQNYIQAMFGTFYMEVRMQASGPITVLTKGLDMGRRYGPKIGEVIEDLGDRCPSVRGLSWEAKMLLMATAAARISESKKRNTD